MSSPGDGPFLDAWEVDPDDVLNLPRDTRALYVGRKGNLRVMLPSGSVVNLRSVPTGTFLHLSVRRILKSGTTAKFLVAFL